MTFSRALSLLEKPRVDRSNRNNEQNSRCLLVGCSFLLGNNRCSVTPGSRITLRIGMGICLQIRRRYVLDLEREDGTFSTVHLFCRTVRTLYTPVQTWRVQLVDPRSRPVPTYRCQVRSIPSAVPSFPGHPLLTQRRAHATPRMKVQAKQWRGHFQQQKGSAAPPEAVRAGQAHTVKSNSGEYSGSGCPLLR